MDGMARIDCLIPLFVPAPVALVASVRAAHAAAPADVDANALHLHAHVLRFAAITVPEDVARIELLARELWREVGRLQADRRWWAAIASGTLPPWGGPHWRPWPNWKDTLPRSYSPQRVTVTLWCKW